MNAPQVRSALAVPPHVTDTATSLPPAAPDEPVFSSVERQRAHVRVKVALSIKFSSVHNFFAGFVENLSAGGIFIATYQLLPVGETLAFEILVPGHDVPVTGVGEVRWVREPQDDSDTEPGMGLRFLTVDGDGDRVIRGYVERRDPIFFEE